MVPEKNWGPVPSPDPTPEDPGVWKALIGQMWVMCPALTQSKVPRGLEGSDWSGMGYMPSPAAGVGAGPGNPRTENGSYALTRGWSKYRWGVLEAVTVP